MGTPILPGRVLTSRVRGRMMNDMERQEQFDAEQALRDLRVLRDWARTAKDPAYVPVTTLTEQDADEEAAE